VKLIFIGTESKEEITTTLGTTVHDVKLKILEKHWPQVPGYTPPQDVDRLRLFAAGKEVGGNKPADDQKTLRDCKFNATAGQTNATPVHVQPVMKKTEQPAEKETAKPSQCFCTLL